MKIDLLRVRYIPKELKPGLLYVSEEFGIAVHLCACGCGTKVSTPLGPTEWTLEEADNRGHLERVLLAFAKAGGGKKLLAAWATELTAMLEAE